MDDRLDSHSILLLQSLPTAAAAKKAKLKLCFTPSRSGAGAPYVPLWEQCGFRVKTTNNGDSLAPASAAAKRAHIRISIFNISNLLEKVNSLDCKIFAVRGDEKRLCLLISSHQRNVCNNLRV